VNTAKRLRGARKKKEKKRWNEVREDVGEISTPCQEKKKKNKKKKKKKINVHFLGG
jgi:hypothetical protein